LDESEEAAMARTSPSGWLAMPLAGGLVGALFPPACPACRGETATGQTLCPNCWAETAFLSGNGCIACGREIPGLGTADAGFRCDTCQTHPPVWDRGAAVFAYEGAGRRLVLGLKHGDRLDMLPMLGGWMLRAGRELMAEADLVIPVPMHWTRRLKRRFNQSAELARALCLAADRSDAFAPGLLRRTRRTGSQDGRDRAGRAENLRGCIGLTGDGGALAGRRVLLIDDVLTTGATLNAVAGVCRHAGALTVDILVLALVSFDEAPYLRSAWRHQPKLAVK
jgi:predicted amidophosphoribosyltransferase